MQQVTMQLPDDIYRRIAAMAAALRRPVEEVLVLTIRGNLPPILDDLPADERDLIAELAPLSDAALHAIVTEPLPAQRWRRHRHLLGKAENGTLNVTEQEELAQLRSVVDRSVIRRSVALALLKWRGLPIPLAS